MSNIYYVSEGKLYTVQEGNGRLLTSEAAEKYRQNLKEIEKRQEWKTSGAGARFMGMGTMSLSGAQSTPEHAYVNVESLTAAGPEKLIYALSLETSAGLHTKNPLKEEAAEGFILRRNNTRIHHIDCNPRDGALVASVSDGPKECHIAIIKEEHSEFHVITEGETMDITPSYSRANPQVIYYSSAGYYIDPRKSKTYYGSYCLNRLDLESGSLTEVMADEKYDYIRPKETASGKLYCIRRPKTAPKERPFLLDILLIPFRLLKAIFGWLNFFSRRYTGESLVKDKEGGSNPAKHQMKSEEEIFIEGNLINAEKALKENIRQGEKYPGIAPKGWELVLIGENGDIEIIKKGVLDYAFDGEDLLFSNGKYLIRRRGRKEEVICQAKVAASIVIG